jgi:hypothetical protein
MASSIDSLKGQSLSKVIDVFSMLLLRTIVAFGENRDFLRVGFNYFTEIGLRYLLTMKDLIKPASTLSKRAKAISSKKFVNLLESISGLEVKNTYQSRIQALIDHSRKYIGREINTTNVQDAALKQMIAGFKKFEVKMIQQPELKEMERVLSLILGATQAFMRRTDLVDYVRSFKSPSFMKTVKDDQTYVSAEKEFFGTIKKFGSSYKTFFIFRNFYSTMIKKFQNELDRDGKIVKEKPAYTKTDLQMLDYLTTTVDAIVKVLEKVEWYLAPEIL